MLKIIVDRGIKKKKKNRKTRIRNRGESVEGRTEIC